MAYSNVTSGVRCLDQIPIEDLLALWRVLSGDNTTLPSVGETSTSRELASFAVVIVVSSVSVVVNAGSLLAISQLKKVNAYLRLVISLSLSDILVGVRVLFNSFDIRPFTGQKVELCAFVCLRGLKMTSHLISLFNLLGLGLDHYCAIVRPLRHRSHMTELRTNVMIACFWTVSLLCGYSDFFLPAPFYSYCNLDNSASAAAGDSCSTGNLLDLLALVDNRSAARGSNGLSLDYDLSYSGDAGLWTANGNSSGDLHPDGEEYVLPSADGFCYRVMCSKYDPEYIVLLLAAILLVIMAFIYLRVCVKIYSMRRLLSVARSRRVFRRNKKGLVTTLIIVGTFMVCWLPFCLFTSVTVVKMALYPHSSEQYYKLSVKVDKYLYALLLLNSLCDPVIYALRMREVQSGYCQLLARCCRRYKAFRLATDGLSSSFRMASLRYSRHSSRYNDWPRDGLATAEPREETTGSASQPPQHEVYATWRSGRHTEASPTATTVVNSKIPRSVLL